MTKSTNFNNPLHMASLGWLVFPCHSVTDAGECTCGDSHDGRRFDSNSIGKHPRITDWNNKATTDPNQISSWQEEFGQVNWAVVCHKSGLLVIDVDPRHGGSDSLYRLEQEFSQDWVRTLTIATGKATVGGLETRGTHFYFSVEPGFSAKGVFGSDYPGIDVKHNGYVMASGSRHASGVCYEVTKDYSVATLPQKISAQLVTGTNAVRQAKTLLHATATDPTPYGAKAMEGELEKMRTAPQGSRNNQLFKTAARFGDLISAGHIPPTAVAALVLAALDTGLSRTEIDTVLERPNGPLAEKSSAAVERSSSSGSSVEPNQVEFEGLLSRAGLVDWQDAFSTDWEQEWLVPGFISAERGHSLYSDAGLGKSVLVRQMCAELAAGQKVLGTVAFPRPLRVLYFDHENSVHADVVPHLRQLGFTPETLTDLLYLSFPEMAELDTAEGGQQFCGLLDHFRPDFVVLDTVSRTIIQDENLNKTWLDFYRYAGSELKSRRIAYLRLDHSGKVAERGQRGGSAKKGDVDLVWHMSKSGDDRFLLTCEKKRLPIPADHIDVQRLYEPFRHQLTEASLQIDWAYLVECANEWEELRDFVLEQTMKKDSAGGVNAIWRDNRDEFLKRKWRKREVEEAHRQLKDERAALPSEPTM